MDISVSNLFGTKPPINIELFSEDGGRSRQSISPGGTKCALKGNLYAVAYSSIGISATASAAARSVLERLFSASKVAMLDISCKWKVGTSGA